MQILPNSQSGRLLLIDDRPDHWAIIQPILEQQLPNLKTVRLSEAKASLDYLNACITQNQALPTLILLDMYLPDREIGLSLLQQIKQANTDYSLIPVVVLSDSDDERDVEEMYQAGCSSYLVKPATGQGWQDLIQKIKNYWWDTVTRPHSS